MADENFVVEVEIDFRNAAAGAARMAEVLSRFNRELDSPALRNAERNLAKFATGSEEAARKQRAVADETAKSQQRIGQSLSTTRYAMFSTAATLGVISAGLLAFNVATIGAAVAYERAFANVVRTSDALRQSASLTANLRAQFIAMAQDLPVAFESLAEIGTLGNQLGVQTKNLSAFTRVVAQFATVTGITAEESATAFGRLDALLPGVQGDYVALGSAILKAGVTSVATEAQIVKTSVQISAMGTQAGLTASEVVGLSAAFASIGVQPELSRGTVTRLFSQMGKAIDESGDKVKRFAEISGVSVREFSEAYGTDKFGGVFQKFMAGIAKEGTNANSVLQELGINSVRDRPALINLANAGDSLGRSFGETAGKFGLLRQTFDAAADGFRNKTEIFDQYGVITETVSAKLQILANNFQVFLAAIGESSAGPFSFLIDSLTQMLKFMSSIAANPWGQALFATVGIVTALGAVLTGAAAATALMFAGIVGLQQALAGLGVAATGVGLPALITQLSSVAGGAGIASVAVKGLALAFKGVGLAAVVLAAGGIATGITQSIGAISTAVQGLDTSYKATLDRIKGQDISKYFNAGDIAATLNRAFAPISGDTVLRDLAKVDEGLRNIANNGGALTAAKQLEGLSNAMIRQHVPLSSVKAAYTDTFNALDDLGFKVQESKNGFLTIVAPTEAAAKAAGNLSTAEEIAAQHTEDLATSLNWTTDAIKSFISDFASASAGFVGYSDAVNVAQQRTAEAAADAAGKGKESWKDFVDTSSVNMAYFGEALQNQINSQQTWITDVGTLASKGADSFAQGLAKMGPEGAALAHSAVQLSSDELMKLEDQARLAAFLASDAFAQGFTDGFPRLKEIYDQKGIEAVQAYIHAQTSEIPGAVDQVVKDFDLHFSDSPVTVTTDVDTGPAGEKLQAFIDTPRITVPMKADADPGPAGQTLDLFLRTPRSTVPLKADADPSPAGQTLNLFLRTPRAVDPVKADADPEPARKKLSDLVREQRNAPVRAEATNVGPTDATLNSLARTRVVEFQVKQTGTTFISSGGDFGGQGPLLKKAAGGYIRGAGTATSDSINARLSNGEYVIRAASVRQYGTGFFDALNRGAAKFKSGGQVGGYANGGAVRPSGGTSIVELSPIDRDLLRQAGNLQVVIPGQFIGAATNAFNTRQNETGAI